MNYRHKYLKYRKKCSLLKTQLGGDFYVKVNGPTDCHIYKISGRIQDRDINMLIYMFGDVHGSFENMCFEDEKCVLDDNCFSLSDFVRVIINRNANKNIIGTYDKRIVDIFLEQGYTSNKHMYMAPTLFRLQNAKDQFIDILESLKMEFKATVKVFPLPEVHPGPLNDLSWRNFECLRHGADDVPGHANCIKYTYFHKADYREETRKYFALMQDFHPSIIKYARKTLIFLNDYALISKYEEEIDDLQNFLLEYLAPGKTNEFNLVNIINSLAQRFLVTEEDDGMTNEDLKQRMRDIIYSDRKINKQMENTILEQTKLKTILDGHIDSYFYDLRGKYRDFIDAYKTINDEDLNVEDIIKDVDEIMDKELSYLVDIMDDVEGFLKNIGIVYMDIYAICRIFRKFVDGHMPSRVIISAGRGHIKGYVEMIERIKQDFPELNVSLSFKEVHEEKINRCITIDKFDRSKLLDMNI